MDALERFDPFGPDSVDDVATRLLAKWRRIAGKRGWPSDLVDAAASEAWIRMLKRRHLVGAVKKLDAWANEIFINCMLDLMTGASRTRSVRSLDDDERPFEPADRGASPEDRLLLDETAASCVAALGALTERERIVWNCFARDGEPAADVAARLGITADRVRHISSKLRRRLWEAAAPGRRRPTLRADAPQAPRAKAAATAPARTAPDADAASATGAVTKRPRPARKKTGKE